MGLGLKRLVKHLAKRMGYEILRRDRNSAILSKREAQLLDVYLHPSLSGGARLKIVQIGANNGYTEDPLIRILNVYDVEAVLVEPLPDLAASLRQRYADRPDIRVEAAAVGDQGGKLDLYVAMRAEDGEIADTRISSFVKAHVESHISNRKTVEPEIFGKNPHVSAVLVDVFTVSQILERAGWKHADVLVTDAEGFDAVIIRSVLTEKLRFSVIYFEHLNIPLFEYKILCNELNDAGYSLAISGKDTLAVLPSFIQT